MGRKPIGRKAMTNAERQRRFQAKQRAAKFKRMTAKMDATAKQVIATTLAGGDLDGATVAIRQNCIADAEAVLSGLRAAGLSIVKTSALG